MRKLCAAALAGAAGCLPALAAEPTPAELEWLRKNAVALKSCEAGSGFDDLQPLKAIIGDARIVSLGECTHGTREVFQMKHRLVEFLATQMGFTIFSIEASMPEAYRLNDYVLEGKGDAEELINGMYFWTWNTHEVKAMVEWMREFNKSGKGRIEFTGFDMQTPDVAMQIVTDFLAKADAERGKKVEDTYKVCREAGVRQSGGANFGVATASFPVDAARGKKIRYSGWIKTKDVSRVAPGLWWRADGAKGVLAFENSQERSETGTSDWKENIIELSIPAEITNINFGATFPGGGKAWFDGLRIEIDGKPYEDAGALNLDFERDGPDGFFTGGEGYKVDVDDKVAKTGSKSLRMEHTAAAAKSTDKKDNSIDPADAAKRCGTVLAEMESERERYVKVTTAKDADWAIQNARVVLQCMQMRSNEVERDESMARNVKWIFEHAKPGTRIVLWAHNGHVSRAGMMGGASMGAVLDRWYGPEQVIIGFSAGQGEYTAINRGKGLRSDNPLVAPPAGSVEQYFHAAGMPIFLLDLKKASSEDPASAWLCQPRQHLSIGALAMNPQHFSMNVPKSYDALIYFDKTTASRPLPRAGGKSN
jgi:erythromycin esterase-like protein